MLQSGCKSTVTSLRRRQMPLKVTHGLALYIFEISLAAQCERPLRCQTASRRWNWPRTFARWCGCLIANLHLRVAISTAQTFALYTLQQRCAELMST